MANHAILALASHCCRAWDAVKTLGWESHHLGPFRWQRLPPLFIAPEETVPSVGRGREPPLIREKLGRCVRRSMLDLITGVPKLPSERVHCPFAGRAHYFSCIEQRAKPWSKCTLAGIGFRDPAQRRSIPNLPGGYNLVILHTGLGQARGADGAEPNRS